MSIQIAASLMCADMLHLQDELRKLEEAKIEYIHFDIMDGHFVPNLMLSPELVKIVRKATSIPFDIHLMVESPERFLPWFDIREGDYVSVHCESTPHVHRALAMIKERGAKPMAALNPGTPLENLYDLLDDLSAVLIMSVDPGYSGQKLIPGALNKMNRLRKTLDSLGYSHIAIEVDGNCSFENALRMHQAGADIFVSGSSGIFNPRYGIVKGAELFRKTAEGQTVPRAHTYFKLQPPRK